MGWPAHNPELYEELITARLPDDIREKVESGDLDLYDVADEVLSKASEHVDQDYAERLIR